MNIYRAQPAPPFMLLVGNGGAGGALNLHTACKTPRKELMTHETEAEAYQYALESALRALTPKARRDLADKVYSEAQHGNYASVGGAHAKSDRQNLAAAAYTLIDSACAAVDPNYLP